MTIDEAARSWGVKNTTVLDYLYKGYIDGIRCEGSRILIPEIPKPMVKSWRKTKVMPDEKACAYILEAIRDNLYVNAQLLRLTKEYYENLLQQMEESKLIQRIDSTAEEISVLQYRLTPETNKQIQGKRAINVNLNGDLCLAKGEFNFIKIG